MDIAKLEKLIAEVRRRAKSPSSAWRPRTNLIGGQPFSMANLREVREVCDQTRPACSCSTPA